MLSGSHHKYLQDERNECGLSCIAFVAGKGGADVSVSQLRQRHGSPGRMLSVAELLAIAQEEGYQGRALKLSVEECRSIRTPAILLIDDRHYVVFLKRGHRGVSLFDPAAGVLKMPEAEFAGRFSGVAVELSPIHDFKPRPPPSRLQFRSLIRIDRATARDLAFIAGITVLVQANIFIAPLFLKFAIDNGLRGSDAGLMSAVALGFLTLAALNAVSEISRGMMVQRLSAILEYRLTHSLITKLLKLPQTWFSRRSTSDIYGRFDSVKPVNNLVAAQLVVTLADCVVFLFVAVCVLFLAPKLAAIAAIALVGCMAIEAVAIIVSYPFEVAAITSRIGEQGNRIEIIQKSETIRSQFLENLMIMRWSKNKARELGAGQVAANARQVREAVKSLMERVAMIVVVWVGITQVSKNNASLGELYIFITYFNIYVSKGYALISRAADWRLMSVHTGRLADIVLSPARPIAPDELRVTTPLIGHVDMRDCYFNDSLTGANLLRGLSMHVRAGQSVSIKGPRASGKTTMAKMMSCAHGQVGGDYRIGELPPSLWSTKSLRDGIGVALEADDVLAGTIAQNISRFSDAIDLDRLGEVSRLVGIEFAILNLPQQYNTQLTELHAPVSTVIMDRLRLARALYHRPKVLIIDSGPCERDARLRQNVLDQAKAIGATIFLFHNDPAVAQMCDLSYRLDGGTLRAMGATHLQPVTPEA